MTKTMKKRVMSAVLALALILPSLLTVIPIRAAGDASSDGANNGAYTRKVVSVLFDNSGSMLKSGSGKANDYALYSMRMLMAMLNPNDALYITPMNVSGRPTESASACIKVNLDAEDKQSELDGVITKLDGYWKGENETPSEPIRLAIDCLKNEGLKTKDEETDEQQSDTEYWLIVLTDGKFTSLPKGSNAADFDKIGKYYDADDILSYFISEFVSLRSVYVGLTSSAQDLTDKDLAKQNSAFRPFYAKSYTDLTGVMESIANLISGRYSLAPSNYQVSGNTVTIDLNQSGVSLKSVSVISQDCDAELSSVTYNGKAVIPSTKLVLEGIKADDFSTVVMKNGCSAVMQGDPYFSGGKLVMTFTKDIDPAFFTVMVEPALRIEPFLEYQEGSIWKETDIQYINSHLTPKDHIRARYRVYEMAHGKEVDIDKIFGTAESHVNYAGKGYDVGEAMKLVKGKNTIGITVSVMNGAYTMYTSLVCIVEENPSYYRVTGEHGKTIPSQVGKTDAYYTVYSENKPVTAQLLNSDYTWKITVTAPDGKKEEVEGAVGSDGRIAATIRPVDGQAGEYRVTIRVTREGISREYSHTLKYYIGSLEIDSNVPSQMPRFGKQAEALYTFFADGSQMTKEQTEELIKDKCEVLLVRPNGSKTALTKMNVRDDGVLAVTLDCPEAFGEYAIQLKVKTDDGKTTECTDRSSYMPGLLTVEAEYNETVPFDLKKANARFSILMDGEKMTKAELEHYKLSVAAADPQNDPVPVRPTIETDGTIDATLDLASREYGIYLMRISLDVFEGYKCERELKFRYVPSDIAVNVIGDPVLQLSQYQIVINDQPLRFELMAGGTPFRFDSDLVKYTVYLGSRDVTEYVSVRNNILTFKPNAGYLEGEPKVGELAVRVEVNTTVEPSLHATGTATLAIVEPIYEVELVESGDTTVDRFKLGETTAKLYFRALRDGIPLTFDELTEAMEKGEIKLSDDSGTFTSRFLLPCGGETEVGMAEDDAVVVFRVKKDMWSPLACFCSMLISNGEKGITVSYNSGADTGNIVFAKSGAWSYIWRIALLIFIIHTILYAIGFIPGVCNSLPVGMVITIGLGNDNKRVELYGQRINFTRRKQMAWHIKRFFPNKNGYLFYHQPKPVNIGSSDIVMVMNQKTGTPHFLIKADGYMLCSNTGTNSMYKTAINQMRKSGENILSVNVNQRVLRSTFRIQRPCINGSTKGYSPVTMFCDSKINNVVIFAEKLK